MGALFDGYGGGLVSIPFEGSRGGGVWVSPLEQPKGGLLVEDGVLEEGGWWVVP